MSNDLAGRDEVAATSGFDLSTPNAARIYDYLLGGKDNFAADRHAANRLLSAYPAAALAARANRIFLAAAVRYVARRGDQSVHRHRRRPADIAERA